MASTNAIKEAPVTLLFGPHTLSFHDQWFHQLRSSIRGSPENAWMQEVIRNLPEILGLLLPILPNDAVASAPTLARSIGDWLDSDASSPIPEQLPNAILTPLIVLSHLEQYTRFTEAANLGSAVECSPWSATVRPQRLLGFCTGFLSAVAAACSTSDTDFQKYGAVAVRLAALAGAAVDAAEITSTDSMSISTAWTTSKQESDLQDVIADSQEAYISVFYDDTRATVTTTSKSGTELIKQLRSKGIIASDISLRGRYHWSGHQQILQDLIKVCADRRDLQFPDSDSLLIPLFSTTTSDSIKEGKLHNIALRDILVGQCNWHSTFCNVDNSGSASPAYFVFGDEKCIPPTALRRVNDTVVYMADHRDPKVKLGAFVDPDVAYPPGDIAVVGMACKVAGADDMEELWDLMCRGESQHVEVPESRFTFDTHWRETDVKRKWFGNFLRDHDAFDHKFFKKSPREVSSQDPQQRLFLQSAYQAVEQSGYFNLANPDTCVGVFAGVCAADYEANVACYPPNAFTATGNLKSFITGKISHYFGWTGPALTIDTACSASAVAIHQACKAILSGECNSALAGGVTIMTSPLWFQNLAGATFLSPTGSCKPFDADADGYCRGEAIASVFLKKISQAVKDGDTILGRIRSTAVLQNDNCTPIFVPNAPSLSTLFEDVVDKARLRAADISLVEAHGTGTPVGDPAEYESIRRVLGGRDRRTSPLHLGSIKGLIGHTESASGVVALIKVLLLLYHGFVPPQASFKSLSSGVNASADDMIQIDTQLVPWKPAYRAALINNYGASGSNASMIVSQAHLTQRLAPPVISAGELFWIPGRDERSLHEYCVRLRALLGSRTSPSEVETSLANLSYSLSRQSNRSLPMGLIFQSSSLPELERRLSSFVDNGMIGAITTKRAQRPVILCFGGQISRSVGLDKMVFDRYGSLRTYLNQCDSILLSLGYDSIFPTLFEKSPILDTVKLQTTLFALQYSCAQCWIDSGVPIAAVVGHSFGELTAMCVAGVLSLKDTLAAIAARGRLVRELWGSDPGAMIAVDAELSEVHELLRKASSADRTESPVSIACYNGPRSFTLAGSTAAVKKLEASARTMPGIRHKLLSVANAYHSMLVEPLEEQLVKLSRGMLFTKAKIHWERATDVHEETRIRPDFFATHMRLPVYANQAFQRLNEAYPEAIWLEAGSNSTITNLAGRALGQPKTSHFQPLNICSPNGLQNSLDVFISLWKEGLSIHHWGHHASQARQYDAVILPPYQFERSRHWLELKKPVTIQEAPPQLQHSPQELPTSLYTFTGYQDEARTHARFRVNTMIPKYEELITGHIVAGTAPICPATVQIDIVVEALLSLRPDLETANMQPEIRDVANQVPVCINPSRALWVDLRTADLEGHAWDWEIVSTGPDGSHSTLHVKGQITFRAANDKTLVAEFSRYERLMSHKRCLDLLHFERPDDIIQGRNMYRVFAEIVDYATPYHGLEKLVGKHCESAGRVRKKHSGQTWLDAHLADCFSQVGGFWVNCMTDRDPADMYIAAGFEHWARAPREQGSHNTNDVATWDIMAIHHKASDKAYTTDIFVYDSLQGTLHEVILGVNYSRIPKAIMIKTLNRLTLSPISAEVAVPPSQGTRYVPPKTALASSSVAAHVNDLPASAPTTFGQDPETTEPLDSEPSKPNISKHMSAVSEVLAELTGLELEIMKPSVKLADIGIDSLMGMEMTHELESTMKISLDMDRLAEATSVQDVMNAVAAALGLNDIDMSEAKDDSDSAYSDGASPSIHTPGEDVASSNTNVSDGPSSDLKMQQPAELQLVNDDVLKAFGESKSLTDKFIDDFGCSGYLDGINPKQTQLCVALIAEAFEELGCPITSAKAGDILDRIPYASQHTRLVDYLYEVLEVDARLVDIEGSIITRTVVNAPYKSSKEIIDGLVATYPDHNLANRLTHYCGLHLVEVLKGKADGVKVIFGTDEGRNLVSGLYGDSLLNKLFYAQMQDILRRLVSHIPLGSSPFKILEMGAGTGGTTIHLVPLLAELNIPVEYTFTDLASSFVAAARKKYKAYPFMRFMTHDIEKSPPADLVGTQHLVIASNAVHATHSLPISLTNIRKFLRQDGFLMMLEMTETLRWVDMIFGILEGWWLFDDGRQHALSHQSRWERELHAAGYGHVDWTDGERPENRIQRIIIAMASGVQRYRLPVPKSVSSNGPSSDIATREQAVDYYVQTFTQDYAPSTVSAVIGPSLHNVILVTGATGSVGSHLVAHLTTLPHVTRVICLNRPNRGIEPEIRQQQAFKDRGLIIDSSSFSKLQTLQCDASKPFLGLPEATYNELVASVTHVVHNAWPMSGNRPLKRFEPQFQTMRNLIDLCHGASAATSRVVSFQFISSIAVVGHHPLLTGQPIVPEEHVQIASVLPNGYGDAKLVCERMLATTLAKQPKDFRTMSVRLGQVAGNSKTGYWNTQEHLSFLIKSSQTLRCLPDFEGPLSWTPVDLVAGALSDLLLQTASTPYPIYNIDNPVRQPWEDMIRLWASALNIPHKNIIPYPEWVARVRHFPGSVEKDNPAYKLIDFLDDNFRRMSCGGLLLATDHAEEHSPTLASVGPVSAQSALGFINFWRETGFLS